MNSLLKEGNRISVPTAAYSQEANAVERLHRALGQRLRSLTHSTGKPWSSVLAFAVHGYNVTRHSMTDQAPFTLMMSKEVDINTLSTVVQHDIHIVRD